MRKKTILILWIIGLIIAIIGVALFVPSIVAAANNCTTNSLGGQSCSLPTSDPRTATGLIGVLVIILGGLISAVAWIGALVRSAKMQDWVWFVIVLVFNALGTLIYLIASRSDSAATPQTDAPYSAPRS